MPEASANEEPPDAVRADGDRQHGHHAPQLPHLTRLPVPGTHLHRADSPRPVARRRARVVVLAHASTIANACAGARSMRGDAHG